MLRYLKYENLFAKKMKELYVHSRIAPVIEMVFFRDVNAQPKCYNIKINLPAALYTLSCFIFLLLSFN